MNLTIPTRNDPIARFAVLTLLALALWASFAPARPDVQAQDIIIMATPTPALPTPALVEPAIVFALPTPVPLPANLPAVTSQEPFSGTEANADADYIANVGAQAPHSPRGDVAHPPSFGSGVVLDPGPDVRIDPSLQPPDPSLLPVAVAVPPISDAQAAVIGARQSNGCAAGEVFYPRTGCHLPGSGGPLPGAVGGR